MCPLRQTQKSGHYVKHPASRSDWPRTARETVLRLRTSVDDSPPHSRGNETGELLFA